MTLSPMVFSNGKLGAKVQARWPWSDHMSGENPYKAAAACEEDGATQSSVIFPSRTS